MQIEQNILNFGIDDITDFDLLKAKYLESQNKIVDLEKRLEEIDNEKSILETSFKEFSNNLCDGAILIDKQNRIIKINDKAKSLFEFQLDDNSLNTLEDVFPDDLIFELNNQKLITFVNESKESNDNNIHIADFNVSLNSGTIKHFQIYFYTNGSINPNYFIFIKDLTSVESLKYELLESEKLFDEIFEDLPLGVAILDSEEYFLRSNNTLNLMFGMTSADLLSFRLSQIISHESDLDLRRIINGDLQYFSEEVVFNNSFGESYYSKIYLSQTKWDGINRVILFVQDITEGKLAELQLKRSKEKYQALFERANDAIIVFEPANEIILETNKAAIELYGYSRSELIGMSLKDLTFDVKKGENNINSLMQSARISDIETVHFNRKKEKIFMIVNASIIDFDGVSAILSINRDITELKNKSELLSVSETITKAAFEQAAVGILQTDIQGEIIKANKKFANLTGYKIDELNNLNYAKLTHPDDYQIQMEKDWQLISSELNSYSLAKRFIAKNGNILWTLNTTTAIRSENGAPKYFFSIIEDISERKQAEENLSFYAKELQSSNQALEKRTTELMQTVKELKVAKHAAEEASKVKSQFVANISHEIRTPLNVIINSAELLGRQIKEKPLIEYIEGIQLSGSSLLTLINDILDLSKMEAGKFSLKATQCNMKDLVKGIEKIFRISCESKGIHINSVINLEYSEILFIDEVRINQALFNLVGNAVKFTNSGEIKIIVNDSNFDSEKQTVSLHICVIDTGCGIEENKINYVFSQNINNNDKHNDYYYGEGLGLPITKRIIDMMQGRLSVETKINEGTTFDIILDNIPISLFKNKIDSKELELTLSCIKKMNFLSIAENILGNNELKEIIEPRRLFFVSNIAEAIKVVNNESIDIIFIEFWHYQENSIAVLKELRKYSTVPVLALLKSDSDLLASQILNAGFTAWIKRPLNIDKITNILSALNYDFRDNVINRPDAVLVNEEELERLMAMLENELFEDWRAIMKAPYIKNIKSFASKLKKINGNCQILKLDLFADELLELAKSYNVTGLQNNLEKFPIILEELTNIK